MRCATEVTHLALCCSLSRAPGRTRHRCSEGSEHRCRSFRGSLSLLFLRFERIVLAMLLRKCSRRAREIGLVFAMSESYLTVHGRQSVAQLRQMMFDISCVHHSKSVIRKNQHSSTFDRLCRRLRPVHFTRSMFSRTCVALRFGKHERNCSAKPVHELISTIKKECWQHGVVAWHGMAWQGVAQLCGAAWHV